MYLIIGYGNPLRCDDGIGQYLAEKLGECWKIITSTQLVPELAEPISRMERVVFIDARLGPTPGEVVCEPVRPSVTDGAFTHNTTPASLLTAARDWYGHAPPAILITITGASFEYGDEFSPIISAALPEIMTSTNAMISGFFINEGGSDSRSERVTS